MSTSVSNTLSSCPVWVVCELSLDLSCTCRNEFQRRSSFCLATSRHSWRNSKLKKAFAWDISKELHKVGQLSKRQQPRSAGCFLEQNCLQRSGNALSTFYTLRYARHRTGLNSDGANEKAINAVALAVAGLIRCRNPTGFQQLSIP